MIRNILQNNLKAFRGISFRCRITVRESGILQALFFFSQCKNFIGNKSKVSGDTSVSKSDFQKGVPDISLSQRTNLQTDIFHGNLRMFPVVGTGVSRSEGSLYDKGRTGGRIL